MRVHIHQFPQLSGPFGLHRLSEFCTLAEHSDGSFGALLWREVGPRAAVFFYTHHCDTISIGMIVSAIRSPIRSRITTLRLYRPTPRFWGSQTRFVR